MIPVSELGKRLICDEVRRDPNEWDVFLHLKGYEEGAPVYETVWRKREPQQKEQT